MDASKAGRPGDRFDEAFLRKLEALTIVAKRVRAGRVRGERRSRRAGAGIEFADHREYAPGDDVRAIDWNLFARLDRPFIRLREEDEDLTLTLIVDDSASMKFGQPPKLELAARIAAALAYIGLSNLDRVSVSLIADGQRLGVAPVRGMASAARVLDMLERATGGGRTDLAGAVRRILAVGATRRRGLTVLISDLFDPAGWLPAVDRLRAAHHEVVVVQITAPGDGPLRNSDHGEGGGDGGDAGDDDFGDGDVLFEDAETGEVREVFLTAALRSAQSRWHAAWLRGITEACRERGISCFQIATDVPFEDAVLRILRVGGVLA